MSDHRRRERWKTAERLIALLAAASGPLARIIEAITGR